MFKSIKRIAQTPKDMMLALTIDDIQINRKSEQKQQYLQFSYIRGSLTDTSKQILIEGDRVKVDETFTKKTTLYFKNDVVQDKFIILMVKIRDEPVHQCQRRWLSYSLLISDGDWIVCSCKEVWFVVEGPGQNACIRRF